MCLSESQGFTDMLRWTGLIFLASVSGAQAEVVMAPASALIYESGTDRAKPLFRYVRSISPLASGGIRAETRFTEMNGTLAYTEIAESKDGKILLYEWTHHQMEQAGKVEIRGGKAYYSLKKEGKLETATGDAPENLVMGPTVISFAQNHWQELMAGESLKVRVGVADRLGDYGFRFKREEDSRVEQKGAVRVSLSPTSFFVSLAVKPIDFIFTKTGAKLLSIDGRSLLKVKREGKWDDLQAETVFE